MSKDPTTEIRKRLLVWQDRQFNGSLADGFDRMTDWALSAEVDIVVLLEEIDSLRRQLNVFTNVKS